MSNEVPKFWKEYVADVKGRIPALNKKVEAYEAKKTAEYKALPWYKKLTKASPNRFSFELDSARYGFKHFPEVTEPSVEDYYNWLIETGKENG